jgi:hypothetical protein
MSGEEPVRDWRIAVIALLTAFLVGALGAVVWFAVELRQERQEAAAGEEAEEAAREMLGEITTYGHDSLDADFAWIEEYGTPEFAERYRSSAEKVKRFVAANELDVTGTVVDSAHRVEDGDQVVVLAFVDQEFVSTATDEVAEEEQRVRLVMLRDGEEWQVDTVEVLSGRTAAP